MKTPRTIAIAKKGFYIVLFAAFAQLAACSKSTDSSENAEAETADSTQKKVHTLSDSQYKTSGFETGKMALQSFNEVIKTNGIFDVAPENKAVVSAFFGGYVKSLSLLPGQKVKKGETLVVLENPEYVKLQQDYLETKGSLSHLKSEYERQKNLLADNSTSQKNYLKAEAEYNVTQSRYQSLKKQLGMMNIDPNTLSNENMRTEITIKAPISGFITDVGPATGMFVTAQSPIATIINTDHMHLELSIYEKDLTQVRVGQIIKFHVQNNNHEEHFGTVYLINQAINEENRSISVHGHVDDMHPTEIFMPGMYIEAEIFTTTQNLPALPVGAVIAVDNVSYVLVKTSATNGEITFEQREVQTGKTSKGFVEILNASDFAKDTEFLTHGAFNLIVE